MFDFKQTLHLVVKGNLIHGQCIVSIFKMANFVWGRRIYRLGGLSCCELLDPNLDCLCFFGFRHISFTWSVKSPILFSRSQRLWSRVTAACRANRTSRVWFPCLYCGWAFPFKIIFGFLRRIVDMFCSRVPRGISREVFFWWFALRCQRRGASLRETHAWHCRLGHLWAGQVGCWYFVLIFCNTAAPKFLALFNN